MSKTGQATASRSMRATLSIVIVSPIAWKPVVATALPQTSCAHLTLACGVTVSSNPVGRSSRLSRGTLIAFRRGKAGDPSRYAGERGQRAVFDRDGKCDDAMRLLRVGPATTDSIAGGAVSQPNTLRPPYACELRCSASMNCESAGPSADRSSRRACSSNRRIAWSRSSLPRRALSTADFSTAIVWS